MTDKREHTGLATDIICELKRERDAWRAATIILAAGVVIMAAVLVVTVI